MTDMTFIGIDPGQSGGIAWIRGQQVAAIKMPATVKDVADAILERTTPVGRTFCVLELVHSMPKQGVASSFKFGKVTGWVEGAVAALSIPYELVSPTKWQKEMGCLSRGDKNVTKRRAQQLFPAVEKITHAKADALLLADYAKRVWLKRYSPESTG